MQQGERSVTAYYGTINGGGTITQEIDLGGFATVGLIATTSMAVGTLTFEVSDVSGGTYSALKDGSGNAVSIGPVSGTFAVSGSVMIPLSPYRYVKIKTSSAQSPGVQFALPVKA